MKQKILSASFIIITVLLLVLGSLHLYRYTIKRAQEPITMLIASDIHYLSPDYRGEYFKEPNTMFDGKLTHYSNEYFDAFLSEVMENALTTARFLPMFPAMLPATALQIKTCLILTTILPIILRKSGGCRPWIILQKVDYLRNK